MRHWILASPVVAIAAMAMAACGTGSVDPGPGGGADAGGSGGGADAASSECADPAAALPASWSPGDGVSPGQVTDAAGAPGRVLSVDATAGGFGNEEGNPWVYVTFETNGAAKVSITDAESFESAAWDLALKRYVIRANGGDSGPGGLSVGVQDGIALEDVTAAPDGIAYLQDDWAIGASCQYVAGALGAPSTAVGDWFNADAGELQPLPRVYFLRRPGSATIAFQIDTYTSGAYEISWLEL